MPAHLSPRRVPQVYMPRDGMTKRPRGFAFVRFFDGKEAEEAMAREDGRQLRGRTMRCEMAKFGRGEGPAGQRPPSGPPAARYEERRYDDRGDRRYDERPRYDNGGGSRGGRADDYAGGGRRRSRSRSRSRSRDRYRSRSRDRGHGARYDDRDRRRDEDAPRGDDRRGGPGPIDAPPGM
jgi:arginine/serine-rich splicing factor 2